jgi:hypothetical protein
MGRPKIGMLGRDDVDVATDVAESLLRQKEAANILTREALGNVGLKPEELEARQKELEVYQKKAREIAERRENAEKLAQDMGYYDLTIAQIEKFFEDDPAVAEKQEAFEIPRLTAIRWTLMESIAKASIYTREELKRWRVYALLVIDDFLRKERGSAPRFVRDDGGSVANQKSDPNLAPIQKFDAKKWSRGWEPPKEKAVG